MYFSFSIELFKITKKNQINEPKTKKRILPVDAHKLCSGRVHISLTRWKDGKNFLVNQFDTREELIQVDFV